MRKSTYDFKDWAMAKNRISQTQNFAKFLLMSYKIYG
jgi:hypothetical protein